MLAHQASAAEVLLTDSWQVVFSVIGLIPVDFSLILEKPEIDLKELKRLAEFQLKIYSVCRSLQTRNEGGICLDEIKLKIFGVRLRCDA